MNTPVENQKKTPTAGLGQQPSSAGSGAGLGVSPAHFAEAQQHVYEVPYRRCVKAGGITYPIAVCLRCFKVVEPSRKESSKTGAHGTWYYAHEHPLLFVVLEQSNSGRRRVVVPEGFPEPLADAIRRTWTFFHYEPEVIENLLAALLKEKRVG
jgi:hypothetical protein